MTLVLVESPAKAEAVGRFLGAGFDVRATHGHVLDLAPGTPDLDAEPEWVTAKGQRNRLAALRRAAASADRFLLATDPDREGEAIAEHLAAALRTDSPIARVSFRAVTPEAVRSAVAEPRTVDADLAAASLARRVIDRHVGFAVSAALGRALGGDFEPGGWPSGGRVQAAALRLLCERERTIEHHEAAPRWRLTGTFRTPDGRALTAALSGGAPDLIPDERTARQIAEQAFAEMGYQSIGAACTEVTLPPPPPFTTATLLAAAAEQLDLRPERTMRTLQRLYDGSALPEERVGLVTYPRTDALRLDPSFEAALREYVAEAFGVVPHPPQKVPGAMGAHEAIRPVSLGRTPRALRAALKPGAYRLYRLVFARTVASRMPPARLVQETARVTDGEGRFPFALVGTRPVEHGWRRAFDDGATFPPPLPPLPVGTPLSLEELSAEEDRPPPPPRPTEAGLVAALAAAGVGRPSTFVPTLAALRERRYTWRDGAQSTAPLHPTPLGRRVDALLAERFPALGDPALTAAMEARLDAVAAGEMAWRQAARRTVAEALREGVL